MRDPWNTCIEGVKPSTLCVSHSGGLVMRGLREHPCRPKSTSEAALPELLPRRCPSQAQVGAQRGTMLTMALSVPRSPPAPTCGAGLRCARPYAPTRGCKAYRCSSGS